MYLIVMVVPPLRIVVVVLVASLARARRILFGLAAIRLQVNLREIVTCPGRRRHATNRA